MRKDKFKVGDRVWHFVYGWGTVAEMSSRRVFGVIVEFDTPAVGEKGFTEDGEYRLAEPRTLFFEEVPVPESAFIRPYLPEVEVDAPVWVSTGNGLYIKAHFAGWREGKMATFLAGRTSHTEQGTGVWSEWSLTDPAEEVTK